MIRWENNKTPLEKRFVGVFFDDMLKISRPTASLDYK